MRGNRIARGARLHTTGIVAFGLLLTAPSFAACSSAAEPAPQGDAPIVIEGHERLEWEQAGKSLDEVSGYRYMAVFGQIPKDMTDVRCKAQSPDEPFVCSGVLPPMSPGVHEVRLIAIARDGNRNLVSRWSAPLRLQKR